MDISDITATDLQDEITAPVIIKEYREQVTKRMKDDQYVLILSIYVSSIFQHFDSFLRTEIDLVEDDIRLVLDKYNSSFITDELEPGNCTFKDLSETLFKMLQPEYELFNNSIDIELDDIIIKTKLAVRSGIIALKFNEKSFFSAIFGFKPFWDFKHYNEYISQKIVNLNTTNKVLLKFDVITGVIVSGLRQPILFSFILNKPSGYKVFCEPETFQYIKLNKSVLNTITFHLEDDNKNEFSFNGETLTFTLQMIKL